MEEEIKPRPASEDKLVLKLYVAGMSPKSMEAVQNIRRLCDEHLEGVFDLEIVDLYKNPGLASENQIIFSPSLLKILPPPTKALIGTFSDQEKVIKALGITIKK